MNRRALALALALLGSGATLIASPADAARPERGCYDIVDGYATHAAGNGEVGITLAKASCARAIYTATYYSSYDAVTGTYTDAQTKTLNGDGASTTLVFSFTGLPSQSIDFPITLGAFATAGTPMGIIDYAPDRGLEDTDGNGIQDADEVVEYGTPATARFN